jgi:hypothetical protein
LILARTADGVKRAKERVDWLDEAGDEIKALIGTKPPRATLLSDLVHAVYEDDRAAHSVAARCH